VHNNITTLFTQLIQCTCSACQQTGLFYFDDAFCQLLMFEKAAGRTKELRNRV
jgi:hypothetical protein